MTQQLKAGDKVVMHTCDEAEHYEGRIWTCRSDQFSRRSHEAVFLEGLSGYFLAEYLQRVNTGLDWERFNYDTHSLKHNDSVLAIVEVPPAKPSFVLLDWDDNLKSFRDQDNNEWDGGLCKCIKLIVRLGLPEEVLLDVHET